MPRLALRCLVAAIVLTAVLGFAYPGAITGIAQLAFPNRADGSLLEVDGEQVGSRLAAQAFDRPEYFHPRPSATEYDAAGTSFANLGPTNAELAAQVAERANAILALESPSNPGLAIGDIPVDAVTTSGSGIDPHISRAYADLQLPRVAATRGIAEARVRELVDAATAGRALGFFGEPGVNVLELNLALDRETR
jgi:K+-transporting ATPase ATPase C chain